MTGLVPSTASLVGTWSADNGQNADGNVFSNIVLNGVFTGNSISGNGWDTLNPFSISTGFVAGVNTLDFMVYNEEYCCGNPEGLRVEFTSAIAAAAPEPGLYGVLALGFAGLAGAVFVRRRA